MAQLSKEELSFVEDLPKHMEIECLVCLKLLTDPHIVSCCGHNFCGFCIERVKASNGSCPMCKEKEYQAIPDKKCSRIINGLEVYCSNKEKGCQWKGELKKMSTHLNKEKREGECQYEEVKCRYEKCQERKQRRYLEDHEDKECPQRPLQCEYCRRKGTFLSITKDHYEECRQYPVTCPNKCVSTKMPQGSLTAHIKKCPLEPVDCVFSWAGCKDKPLRKDVHVHLQATAIKHTTLLAVACGQLKKENEQMQQEISDLKSRPYHEYPLLPIDVRVGRPAFHFYSNACGRHMSARVMRGNISSGLLGDTADYFVLLAFHEGKFDEFKPKLPKVFFAKCGTEVTQLVVDTYKRLPHDSLNGIKRNESGYDTSTVPQNVIEIKFYRCRHIVDTVTISTSQY